MISELRYYFEKRVEIPKLPWKSKLHVLETTKIFEKNSRRVFRINNSTVLQLITSTSTKIIIIVTLLDFKVECVDFLRCKPYFSCFKCDDSKMCRILV
jgi:hypothetical protein